MPQLTPLRIIEAGSIKAPPTDSKELDWGSIVSFLNLRRPSFGDHFAVRPQFVKVSIKHRWLAEQ